VLDITICRRGAKGCAAAIKALCAATDKAVTDGYNVLILSDAQCRASA